MLTAAVASKRPSRVSLDAESPTGAQREWIWVASIASVDGKGLNTCLKIASSASRYNCGVTIDRIGGSRWRDATQH